ncbi:hypothetical protein [Nitrincola tapanii]|uniref:Phosphoribulokinase/uridine kinase domain-containing protein n=1 Tax=Nitrincola tapanii TaxID=1708751 RepID=A0A5A9W284_9GAMM|nr:hypothetical protein [Nitrincola tapanii]KAA0874712.1 hypothetical protein E1H14_07805 [Nitrincola tapanii]
MSVLVHWPTEHLCLSDEQLRSAVRAVESAFASTLESLRVDIGLKEMVQEIYVPMCGWIACWQQRKGGPLVLGINGAQGAGKSTLFNLLEVTLSEGFGLKVVGFSIDDLYKTRADRERLAQQVHPLLSTRGVPGTHDVDLGIQILDSLLQAEENTVTKIPVFDKSVDDRCLDSVWQEWTGSADIIVFEGWCVGAQAQDEAELPHPVNQLEAEEDPQGHWRRYVNEQLQTAYADLFSRLDLLIMLQVPSMRSVYEWRSLQEKKLAERMRYIHDTQQPTDHLRIMNEEQIVRFIQHYERLTCAMLKEMPQRADLTLRLNENHKICDLLLNQPCCLSKLEKARWSPS